MKKLMQTDTKQHAEAGIVSILVTIIMMLVVSLIIVGMSQVARSNRREQLDQQLSTQAYYAAESGLNKAVQFFAANPTAKINTTGTGGSAADCSAFITNAAPNGLAGTAGTNGSNGTNVLDLDTDVAYTCLMVNSQPGTLQVQDLSQDANKIWRVRDANGQPFTGLTFTWNPDSGSLFTGATNTCLATNALNNLVKYSNWNCAYGILRVDLVDTHAGGSGATLQSPAKTLYLIPTLTSGSTLQPVAVSPPSSGQVGQVVYVACTPAQCSARLSLSPVVSNEYFARLSMIYQNSSLVQLTGTDAGGAAVFSGGQAIIDVTGKAGDQLRRVQARIPLLATDGPVPNFALQSTDGICKSFGVAPSVTADPAACL